MITKEFTPMGTTKTYSEIAKLIELPKSYRAVANACGANKIAIIIPCHLVVGKNNLGDISEESS